MGGGVNPLLPLKSRDGAAIGMIAAMRGKLEEVISISMQNPETPARERELRFLVSEHVINVVMNW
jgi:hypothetical protein